jgi:hypothetical protein
LNKRSLEWYDNQIDCKFSLVDDFLYELEQEKYEYSVYRGDFLPLIDDVDKLNK